MTLLTAQILVTNFGLRDQHTVTATCASGVATGGGGRLLFGQANDLEKAAIVESFPASTTSWTVVATVTNGNWGGGGPTLTVQAYVVCGP